jgi:hypothetical protein
VLLGRNMQPKLPSPKKDELRYFTWYKSSDPIKVDASRRLSAWEPQNEVWSWGVGVSASFTGCGAVGEIGLFVLGVHGPDENGLLVVGELYLLGNKNPAGTLVIEWDGKEERFSFMLGVLIKAKDFVDGAPDWLGELVSVTGTLFASNKRAIFAIGRIADQKTWFRLVVDIDFLLGRTFLEIGAAFEWSEGADGAKGFGLIVRFNGGVSAGVIRLEYNLGLGIVVVSFNNSSSDFSVAFWIEGGLRFVLFGFIRFGISAKAEFRVVGSQPSRGEITFRITIETPWFLPDVTWTFQHEFGELEPERLAVATGALRTAGTRQALTDETQAVHNERLDPGWDPNTPPDTTSVSAIRARTTSAAAREQNFENAGLDPVPTDSAVAVDFVGTVSDNLSIGPSDVGSDQGRFTSGDLTLTTRLTAIQIRRRPRFGSSTAWTTIEQREELTVDFSDPSGATLTGNIEPQTIQMSWDTDVRVHETGAAKRLLINSRTPFEYATVNPEVDEEIVATNPRWPCCPGRRDRERYLRHVIVFTDESPGTQLRTPPATARRFTHSLSPLRLPRPTWARLATGLTSGTPPMVAAMSVSHPGVAFAAYFDRPAVAFMLRCVWTGPAVELVMRGYDREDRLVGEERFKLRATGTLQSFTLVSSQPMRRMTASLVGGYLEEYLLSSNPDFPGVLDHPALELDRLVFVSLEDWVDEATQSAGCNDASDPFVRQYEGMGNVFWLPNHEYEVTIGTQVSIDHPQADVETADLEEHLMFATKGLPGLNAVDEVGAEVRPYVRDAYTGGRGVLYREEPITLAFHEDYSVAVPLASRPAGATGDEATQLFLMRLLAEPQAALGGRVTGTATSDDWIVANRMGIVVGFLEAFGYVVGATSTIATGFTSQNLLIGRLAELTQRPEVTCGLDDPRDVVGPVLVAYPEGATDPADVTRKLWPGRAPLRAVVRREAAPFVHRECFVPIDSTAFEFRTDGNVADVSWVANDGRLGPVGGGADRHALFGDPDWFHVIVTAEVAPANNQRVGVGIGCPASGVGAGLFAFIDARAATDRLVIARRRAAGGYDELAGSPLPATTGTRVMVVHAFDDKVRAEVGETAVEADRGALREGRLCLTAGADCSFVNLDVRGLALFEFDATPSRYDSFGAHLGSWDGRVPRLAPDDMGAGTTSSTVPALLTATSSQITAAMAPTAPALDRETLFTRWATDLGLALRAEPDRTGFAVYGEGGAAAMIVLETPEALDFTEEITLTIAHVTYRVTRPTLPGDSVFADRFALTDLPGSRRGLRDLGGVLSRLDEVTVDDDDRTVEVMAIDGRARARVRDVNSGSGAADGDVHTVLVHGIDRDLRVGDRLVLDADDIFTGVVLERVETPVDVRVLQNGSADKVLIVPVDGAGAATTLSVGQYLLRFRIERRRWTTTDAADSLNSYLRETTLTLSV